MRIEFKRESWVFFVQLLTSLENLMAYHLQLIQKAAQKGLISRQMHVMLCCMVYLSLLKPKPNPTN